MGWWRSDGRRLSLKKKNTDNAQRTIAIDQKASAKQWWNALEIIV